MECLDSEISLQHQPEKSAGHARSRIGHSNHRAIARDVGQGLPALAGEGIGVVHSVSLAQFTLDGNCKATVHGGWRKEDGRGTNPKAALDGKARAARHDSERLGDGAAQLKPRAAAECCPATSNHAAGDVESRAALSLR